MRADDDEEDTADADDDEGIDDDDREEKERECRCEIGAPPCSCCSSRGRRTEGGRGGARGRG